MSDKRESRRNLVKAIFRRIKLVHQVSYEEFWDKVFHNPLEFDLSMLIKEDFDLVVKDCKEKFGERLKVDRRRRKIQIV